jgi:hypothetical protein
MAIGLKIKHSTGEITTGTGNLTLNATGNLILDYATFPASDGTSGQVLTTDGAGNLAWAADDDTPAGYNNANWDTAFGWGDHSSGGYLTSIAANSINDTHIDWGTGSNQVSTADIPENTNLYYTDARADARIVNAGSANWNTAYTHAISAHAPSGAQVNEYSYKTIAISGQTDVVADTTTDTLTFVAGSNMTLTTSGDTITLAASGGGGGIALTDLSVITGSASGAGTLAYNNGTGVFTFQPADLSSYLTSVGALTSHTDVTISGPSTGQHLTWSGSAWTNSSVSAASAAGADTQVQFNDGGNMGADAGLTYAKATDTLTAGTFTTAGGSPTLTAAGALAITTTASNGSITITPHSTGDIILDGQKWPQADGTANQLLKTDGAGQLSWATGSGGIALTDLSVTTASASGAGTLAYNNGTGVFTYQPADLSSYLTSTGVLSSHTDVHNAAPSGSDVLTWSASQSRWEAAAPQFTGLFSLSDTAIDTAADSIAFLDSDNSTKRDTIPDFLTAIAGTNLTAAGGVLNASGGGGGGDTFKTIAVSGQSDVVADSTTDTLTLVAGSNMTVTTTAGTDTITFASSGGGGSSSFTFTVNYATGGTSISTISNLPSGWSSSINGDSVTITHTANGQPMGISFYGLDKSASPDIWKYQYPTSTYPVTFPDSSETISTTEFTLNIGTSATGANTGTPFATSLAHIKVVF